MVNASFTLERDFFQQKKWVFDSMARNKLDENPQSNIEYFSVIT